MNEKIKCGGLLILAVILASALCGAMYLYDNKYTKKGLTAADGLLVVSEGDLLRQPLSYLVRGWSFYPDVLLTPEDFSAGSPDAYMFDTSIGERTRFDSTGDPEDPHGCGSYFLQLRLPENLETYGLELPEIYSAYKLYINDRLVLQMGSPEASDYVPRTQNRMVTFDAAGKASILIAVSDYSHFYSGMVYPPAFGTPLAVNMTRAVRMGIALFAETLALLAGVLSLYFGLCMKHQNARLFSLLCIVTCIFTSYSISHSVFALPIFPWYAMEGCSWYLLALLVVILHNRICGLGSRIRCISEVTGTVFCLTTLCYGLFSSHLTVPVMEAFSFLVSGFKAVFSAYLLATALFSLKNRNHLAAPLFYASVVYAVTFAWDRFLPEYEPVLGGWFIEWGSLILVIAIGCTLWGEITAAYANSLVLAAERRQMTRQLAMQTEYAKQLQKASNDNRRLIHDFRHHLRTVTGLVLQVKSRNETEETFRDLCSYLDEVAHDTVIVPVPQSGIFSENSAVDAILQYYSHVAATHTIRADFQVTFPHFLSLTDVELCTIFGNLLENAVEACLRNTDSQRYILVSTRQTAHTYYLMFENSCDGSYREAGGRFLSHKSTETRFGIGLESVRNIVERHGGTLDIFPLSDKFRAGISLPDM